MKIWTVLLIALIAVGCAGQPRTPLPDWSGAAREVKEVADPIELPELCEIPRDGQWSLDCWRALNEYDIVASGNTDIAIANTEALRKTEAGYDHLILAGQMQQEIAEIRQELLDEERKGRMMDKWFYRGVITLGLLAVSL